MSSLSVTRPDEFISKVRCQLAAFDQQIAQARKDPSRLALQALNALQVRAEAFAVIGDMSGLRDVRQMQWEVATSLVAMWSPDAQDVKHDAGSVPSLDPLPPHSRLEPTVEAEEASAEVEVAEFSNPQATDSAAVVDGLVSMDETVAVSSLDVAPSEPSDKSSSAVAVVEVESGLARHIATPADQVADEPHAVADFIVSAEISPRVATAPTDLLSPNALQRRLAELTDRADNLAQATFSLNRLMAEVQLLAYEVRLVEQVNKPHFTAYSALINLLHHLCGRLTAIATTRLVPNGYYVVGLRRDDELDWQARWTEARRKLDELLAAEVSESPDDDVPDDANAKNLPTPTATVTALYDQLRAALAFDQESEIVRLTMSLMPLVKQPNSPITAEELTRLLLPHRSLFATGADFRWLRRQFDRLEGTRPSSRRMAAQPAAETTSDDSDNEATPAEPFKSTEPFDYLRNKFQGIKVLIIGGVPAHERKQAFFDFFGFEDIDWEGSQDSRRPNNDALVQRIRNGRYQLVLLLIRSLGHHTDAAIRPACEQMGIRMLRVDGFTELAICNVMKQGNISSSADLFDYRRRVQ